MGKQISKLGVDPFHIGLDDQACSVFVDPHTGDILIDEGEGEGRLNGVVLYADKEPRFYSIPLPESGAQLLLSYRKHLLVLGSHADAADLRRWAQSANDLLGSKCNLVADGIGPTHGEQLDLLPASSATHASASS